MQKFIIVQFKIEGIHAWRNCPFDDVAFLKDSHRHLFHIKIEKFVNHGDRDIEFIKLKREMISYFGKQPVDFGGWSCEMIAEKLIEKFDLSSCEVMEDGENGAVVRV